MAALQPKELLDMLLEGSTLTPDEFEQFIRAYPDEDQLFDYKDGILTKPEKRKEGGQIIRKWISGFANSDGGILIVGVDDQKPRRIAPCEPSIGGQTLIEWASRCLQSMVGFFSPPPRFQIIQLSQGPVLTIAIRRAPSLVPCVEAGVLKYFLRIGDSTVEAPAYLISDLVLGRRQHPILDLHLPTIEERNLELRHGQAGDRVQARSISFRFDVENLSLTTAEEVAIGVISWSLMEDEREELNKHLRLYLDIAQVPFLGHSGAQVIHRSSLAGGAILPIAPFQTAQVPRISTFYIDRSIPLKVTCAVYILSKGAPPTWFQLEFGSLPGGVPRGNISSHLKPLIIRKGSERPRVAWEEASYAPQPRQN